MQKEKQEICGAETNNGGTCQNKADSCPWHDEDGNRTDVENGRKGKYNEETISRIVEAAREGLPLKSCARAGNITEETLYTWIDEKDDFSERLNEARSEAERELAKLAREKDPRYILSRSYKWEKPTEKKEHDHNGSPTELNINFEQVDSEEEIEVEQD